MLVSSIPDVGLNLEAVATAAGAALGAALVVIVGVALAVVMARKFIAWYRFHVAEEDDRDLKERLRWGLSRAEYYAMDDDELRWAREAERERWRLYEAGVIDDWRIGGGGDD